MEKSTLPSQSGPNFREALRFWLKLGFISFGGPTGQIAIMHTELVEKKKWISESRFLHALNYCMLLPGPEAQQLAIYCGWLLHQTWGGIAAGTLFVLPAAVLLWLLSTVYVLLGKLAWVAAIFYGVKPAVIAIVIAAFIRLGKRVLKNEVLWLIAAAAFVLITFLKVPFPFIIAGAAILGWLGGKFFPDKFVSGTPSRTVTEKITDQTVPNWLRTFQVLLIGLSLWWIPILAVGLLWGWQHTLFQESIFFSKAAMITFGGAYAVLPYVSGQAVETFHWLSAGQMLDGLGLAETTPGPLIMVLQFVGFLGAWHHPGGLPPFFSASLGAALTTWVTFVPCFLWIFLGAPYIEKLRAHRTLAALMSGVTAAVAGVILSLAVWFGLHVLFPSGFRAPDFFALTLSALALIAMLRFKWGVIPVILACGGAGLVGKLFLGE